MAMMTNSISWKRSPGQARRSYRPMAEINVTPFVDVMLVLLIVFMVTAPLLTAGVPVDLPKSEASPLEQEDKSPLEITLTGEGTIFIGESEVRQDRLVPLLKAMTDKDLDRRIYVRGDQGLAYGKVMDVIGAINRAGFHKVALISEPVPQR